VFRVEGEGAYVTFKDESGGHRWQHVPKNEKKGRVHTSTVTCAVLTEPSEVQLHLRPEDIEMSTIRGSGAGGQKRNKTESCVVLKHVPSGLMVRAETERSQYQNRALAMGLLRARLWEAEQERLRSSRAADRKAQVGVGARGDKRRTIAVQRDDVVDHITGRRWRLKDYLSGQW